MDKTIFLCIVRLSNIGSWSSRVFNVFNITYFPQTQNQHTQKTSQNSPPAFFSFVVCFYSKKGSDFIFIYLFGFFIHVFHFVFFSLNFFGHKIKFTKKLWWKQHMVLKQTQTFYDQIRKIMCREEGFYNNNNNLPIK